MAEGRGFRDWSAIVATWVSVLGAMGGGIFGLGTYAQDVAKQQDSRVVQTFALYEMFNSPARLEARANVFEHTKSGADLDANDLYVMLDFFDAVNICVERNLCDGDLAARLFQSYALPFWDEMGEMIVNSRTESDPNFGAGLQWLAAQPTPAALEPLPSDDHNTDTDDLNVEDQAMLDAFAADEAPVAEATAAGDDQTMAPTGEEP